MNSREWNNSGWSKVKNPSNEIVRTKQYTRHLLSYINAIPNNIKTRKILADVLQIPLDDLLGDLKITVDITKHKHTSRDYKLKKYQRYLRSGEKWKLKEAV